MAEAHPLRRTALILVLAGLLWNLVEAGVGLWSGVQAGSVAIVAFGLDSIGELLAGGVLVWRLRTDRDGGEGAARERQAQRLVGLTFLGLAVYIALHSGANLAGWLPGPRPSPIGLGLVAASAVVMAGLYVGKMRIASRMQSRSLRAEAMESLFCDLQDLTILVGLGLNALFSWWWADPVVAWAVVPLLVKEGLENTFGHEEAGDELARPVCFCLDCWYALRRCPAACC